MKSLAIAELFINIGKAILLLSFAKFMYDETGQIWQISLIFIAEILISTILPILVGKSVDNQGIKKVLIGSAVCHVVFCLAGVLALTQLGMSVSILLLISVFLSFLGPISKMALFSVTPLLSQHDRLEKDNGTLTSAFQGGQLIGMALSAWLLDKFDFIAILIFVVCLYSAASFFYWRATANLTLAESPSDIDKREDPENLWQLFKASKPYMRYFVLSNFDFVTVAIFNIMLVSVVSQAFDGSTYWLAGLDASFAIGAFVGGAVIAKQIRNKSTSLSDVIAIQVAFLIYLGLCFTEQAVYLMPLAIVSIGLFQSYSGIYWRTLLHKQLPSHMIGRLSSIKYIVSSVHIGIVAMVISYAHELGFQYALATAAVITIGQILFVAISIKQSLAIESKSSS
ncbi:MFS transporter [Photorhabdus sp. RM71S]|uniref:MFS transporter n=1 Tax=Photorhabdus sp. RM71S TaxID=3342824 RepID=UPI0036D7E7C7